MPLAFKCESGGFAFCRAEKGKYHQLRFEAELLFPSVDVERRTSVPRLHAFHTETKSPHFKNATPAIWGLEPMALRVGERNRLSLFHSESPVSGFHKLHNQRLQVDKHVFWVTKRLKVPVSPPLSISASADHQHAAHLRPFSDSAYLFLSHRPFFFWKIWKRACQSQLQQQHQDQHQLIPAPRWQSIRPSLVSDPNAVIPAIISVVFAEICVVLERLHKSTQTPRGGRRLRGEVETFS